jgi:hypothetical protein
MGESFPHFHGHMVPRYAETPGDVKTYGVFLLSEAAARGEIQVDEAEVKRICAAFTEKTKGGVPA